MTKKLLIIILNILYIVVFIVAIEFICLYKIYKGSGWAATRDFNHYILQNYIKDYNNDYFLWDKDFRPVAYPSDKPLKEKPPIIIMGCSFVYGLNLQNEETFSYKLASKSKRPVYNIGVVGGGVREALYLLRDSNFQKKYLKGAENSEYVFYVFITDHIFRLYKDIRENTKSPYFKKTKNGGLKYYNKSRLIRNSNLYQIMQRYQAIKIGLNEGFDLFSLYISEINKEIKKHYPNAKFVIIIYNNYNNYNFEKFESQGITVKEINSITKENMDQPKYYLSEHDSHPNKEAWDVITPKIIEEFNL